MFYECDNTNCKLGPEFCRNRAFSELRRRSKARGKFNIGVEVIKTEDRGYGVRSNRSFDPNQIIVEYTGEILTQEECERRMRTVYKKSDVYLPLLRLVERRLTIIHSATISCILIKIWSSTPHVGPLLASLIIPASQIAGWRSGPLLVNREWLSSRGTTALLLGKS